MATATGTKLVAKRSSKYLEEPLYKRLFREGTKPQSVRQQLEEFLKSRKRVYKWEVDVSIRRLRGQKRFHPALKLSEVMAKRGMNLTLSDQAVRLDLVAKSRGIASAEEYFINLPESAKNHLTYGALLNCYCKELLTEKAEGLMEKMKELKFASSPMAYNSLMTLYAKTNQPGKVPGIIQEMKADDVMPDCFTFNVWMRSLAAMNDISGVERVMEEMKRDGRVAADWTTYSNLASIYVDAGMFQKAEGALKELEKRNLGQDVVAYQFLITLYGRTGNLVEVHRIWRSLKLVRPKMANVSYLNMIQVLVNLKDLPGAEACFKEWESNFSVYDIRVANAMIKAYANEGMLDKAQAVKKHAKMLGGRLNAKTWEIFMDYYMNKGDLKMAHWCADRAIKKGKSLGRFWVPPRETIITLIAYFELKKDVTGAEKFIELLQTVEKDLGAEVFEALIRTYAAAGKRSPGMRHRLKMEHVVVGEDTEQLLESICVE
ncbi:large ribosomal subunit protein mL101 (rPPR4)-like [Musa acuminata AAA Group]|uniref:large ribosomal subunit protein mL101 (rPPR4)-like n=1 Tax=Musa acuminata AAA Group TaxID=214697 RepID=UPI0031DD1153